jgi:fumarylpyruvate hydrolase
VTAYPFDPPVPVSAEIAGTDKRFPVNRVFCVGRNYAAHAREMGFDPDREEPFYFTKSPAAIVPTGSTIPYPPGTADFHHEVELVLAIDQAGFEVDVEDALALVYGYAVGLDMTRRDLQLAARTKGRPWSISKDIENGAVISAIHTVASIGHPDQGRIWLDVNSERRQDSDLAKLIWSVPEIIAHLSKYYHLAPGDLIYTGTPDGVGPVSAGDSITGGIDGVADIALAIAG